MKRFFSILIVSIAAILFSCSHGHGPTNSGQHNATGTLQVSVTLGGAGKLSKTLKTAEIEMANLYIVLSAVGQSAIYDTLALAGGNHEQTRRETYSGLAAWVGGGFVEWTLSVEARDRNGRTIHSGDTTFTPPPDDTIELSLFLGAQYSMLVANFFPIRDSVTRCALLVDGVAAADSGFSAQSLAGDTVTLSFDYLTASPSGTVHHIDMNVYGRRMGGETLLYAGDTTIAVKSGENTNYFVVLVYAGADTACGALTMTVTLGSAGTVNVNGVLSGVQQYFLTMMSGGNGTVSGSRRVTHGLPHNITATPDTGYHFVVWRVTDGTATIADPTASSTTVTLENGDATVQGVFVRNGFRKTFGGARDDIARSVLQTDDGGYIIAGNTNSYDAFYRAYLVKTNSDGDAVWTRRFGSAMNPEFGYSVDQAADGGYVIAGYTFFGAGSDQASLTKTTTDGSSVWARNFRVLDKCHGYAVRRTADGGYIITGIAHRAYASQGGDNVLLIKTDSDGNMVWNRTFLKMASAVFNAAEGFSVQQTADGGYVVAGQYYYMTTGSETANVDIYLNKTDASGDTVWTRTFGGGGIEVGNFVRQTADGGYIIVGSILVKTDAMGNELWTRAISGNSVQQTADGGYIVAGSMLIKTDASGNELWTRAISGNSVQQTADGGYIITGEVATPGAGIDIRLVKTDENGNVE